MLRHTFWRPRDVLFFYASLLAASEEFHRKRLKLQPGFVRQIIAGATRTVVDDEFMKEFGASFRNLSDVLDRLKGAPQVLNWRELNSRLGDLVFDTNLPTKGPQPFEWKIELLYEIGLLGALLDRDTSERYSAFRHAFIFNEGEFLTERMSRQDYKGLEYIIHPLFCETLHLDTEGNAELILPLDWDYLHRNEILRGISSP